MNRITVWMDGLSAQWRATIRSAWQSLVGVVLAFLLGALAVAADVVNGGTLEEAATDLSGLARVAVAAAISILSGVVTFAMNRPGAKRSASYGE